MNGSAAVRQLIYKYKMKSCPFSMQLRYVRPSRPNQTHIRKTKLTSAKWQGMRPAPCIAGRRERKPACRRHAPRARAEKSWQAIRCWIFLVELSPHPAHFQNHCVHHLLTPHSTSRRRSEPLLSVRRFLVRRGHLESLGRLLKPAIV